jgi:hypothetical protein
MPGQTYYTNSQGTKTPLPIPAHHHDSVYVRQDQVSKMLRHRAIVVEQVTNWTLPDNVDVNIGAYTDTDSIAVEWESAEPDAPGDVVELGWTPSGVVIPVDGIYFVWGRLDMTANADAAFDNGRLIFGATVNGGTAGTQIERLHQGNSVIRTSTYVGYLRSGDVVSQRLKLLSATANVVRGVEMGVFSIAPFGWSEDVTTVDGSVSKQDLKDVTAASSDFADFQTRIAAL